MDKAAADYFKNPPVPLAGYMPRQAPGERLSRAYPRAQAYDLSAIPVAESVVKTAAQVVAAPIKTVQAGASLQKDRKVTSFEFGKLLRRRARANDPFIERLDRLSKA